MQFSFRGPPRDPGNEKPPKKRRVEPEGFRDVYAEENQRFWENQRDLFQDNADRPIASVAVSTRKPYTALTGSQVPLNLARRVDQLRLTGSPYLSRTIRSSKTPVYDRVVGAVDHYDPQRKVYVCMNCDRMFTPRQLATWYNPGYRSIDLTIVYPLLDRDDMTRASAANAPPRPPQVYPRHELFGDEGALTVVPSGERPVIFVCSQRCAEEQALFNRARLSKLQKIQKEDRTVSTILQDIPGAWRGNHAYRTDMYRFAPNSFLPIEEEDDFFFANEPRPLDGISHYLARHERNYRVPAPYGLPQPDLL